MHRRSLVLGLVLLASGQLHAAGLLIPTDKDTPPLDMVNHQVDVAIVDQVAVTRVTQTFRNHTDRPLEATYVFPVPKGASVNKFTMWVDGKEVLGEMVEAGKARQIYTDIVARTKDPGLLEYVGNNLLRLRVFPVPAHGDQELSLRFTSVAPSDAGLVEYVYPLKTDGKASRTLEKFSLHVTLESQHAVQNVYSPTHAVTVKHHGDHKAEAVCEREQAVLDKDLQLYWTLGRKDVGLTALMHRPDSGHNGHFLLLVSPRAELSHKQRVPRDMVFVLDTSGSMSGTKIEQARKALHFCLDQLGPQDRFAVIGFASTVNSFNDHLVSASSKEKLQQARKWVDELEATGGTAIDDALTAALDYRSEDRDRSFTVVFFTDGLPTIGETDPETIVKKVASRRTSGTRIFTFGVGDDVNAAMLDRLSEETRAVSTYVRPTEDIEVKVSSLYGKIGHPVLTNLKLTASEGVTLSEMYPKELPDLFHGGQLVVLGRYSGKGSVALTLTGKAGKEMQEFVYEASFPEQTKEDKAFVADLWARRKVGYLLDQIRRNGEQKELVEEVKKLAKKHGITTPYTSYLVVPDTASTPVVTNQAGTKVIFGGESRSDRGFDNLGGGRPPSNGLNLPPLLYNTKPAQGGLYLDGGFLYYNQAAPQGNQEQAIYGLSGVDGSTASQGGGAFIGPGTKGLDVHSTSGAPPFPPFPSPIAGPAAAPPPPSGSSPILGGMSLTGGSPAGGSAAPPTDGNQVLAALRSGRLTDLQSGKLGVDLAVQLQELRQQDRLPSTSSRQIAGRTCLEVGGVWIDDGYDAKMPTVVVKAQGKAYFRILERHPEVKEVLQLGNRLIWVTPSGTVLMIDAASGKEDMTDSEIDRLFVVKK
jgi:Ca-activated chloride channel family protein